MYHIAMDDLPRLSIREARARLADVVDQADRDQPTVITRRGRPVAAVVPVQILRRYLELEEREINRVVDERMAERAGGTPEGLPDGAVPLEDVMRETLSRAE